MVEEGRQLVQADVVAERRVVKLADLESRGLSLQFPDGTALVVTADDVLRFLVREGDASRDEAVLFLAYCATRGLNPLEEDVYLVKFQDGEGARIVMGKHGWLKLADRHPQFHHLCSGILVRGKDGKVEPREGPFYDKDKETLVGGWAEVYRKDRPPYSKRVLLEEFLLRTKDGMPRKQWRTMPAVMIEKVALSNALREAFPDLGLGVALAEGEVGEEPQDDEARERKHFWAAAKRLDYTSDEQVHQALGVESLNDWLAQGKSYQDALDELRTQKLQAIAVPSAEVPPQLPRFKTFGEVAEWAYKTFSMGPMKVFADFNIGTWEEFPNPQKAAEQLQAKYGAKLA